MIMTLDDTELDAVHGGGSLPTTLPARPTGRSSSTWTSKAWAVLVSVTQIAQKKRRQLRIVFWLRGHDGPRPSCILNDEARIHIGWRILRPVGRGSRCSLNTNCIMVVLRSGHSPERNQMTSSSDDKTRVSYHV